jgi:quercetin 2,3-dioxygenase
MGPKVAEPLGDGVGFYTHARASPRHAALVRRPGRLLHCRSDICREERRERAMLQVLRSAERGYFDHGWLKTHHTFSFGDYHNPEWVEYGPLRVINDDTVDPGEGFGKHGHRDMEILTYILEGELKHQDSLGNGSLIRVGDVQRMSAGTGVVHSEFNPSSNQPVHLLQIWIKPSSQRLAPAYEQKHFTAADKRGRLRLIASRTGAEGSVSINQDARVFGGLFSGAESQVFTVAPGRRAWVQLARGTLGVNESAMAAGDGARIEGAAQLRLHDGVDAEVLLFDLP